MFLEGKACGNMALSAQFLVAMGVSAAFHTTHHRRKEDHRRNTCTRQRHLLFNRHLALVKLLLRSRWDHLSSSSILQTYTLNSTNNHIYKDIRSRCNNSNSNSSKLSSRSTSTSLLTITQRFLLRRTSNSPRGPAMEVHLCQIISKKRIQYRPSPTLGSYIRLDRFAKMFL